MIRNWIWPPVGAAADISSREDYTRRIPIRRGAWGIRVHPTIRNAPTAEDTIG